MMDFKWIRSNMDLYHIGENCTHIIAISNSGNLAADFYKSYKPCAIIREER